jgi:thioesterase domain-containing protein
MARAGSSPETPAHVPATAASANQTSTRTVETAASAMAVSSHLVKLNGGGDRPPLFLMHPFGGFVFSYSTLASLLGPDQPVFGLQAWGPDPENNLFEDIEVIADRYLEAVRSVQAHGPYRLGGWSMGGAIAYQMAKRAAASGEEMAALLLIDASVPEGRVPDSVEERLDRLARAVDDSAPAVEQWEALGLADDVRRIAAALGVEQGNGSGGATEADRVLLQRLTAHTRAIVTFEPEPYAGEVVLYRAGIRPENERRDPTLGWDRLALGGVEVCVVPGDHLGIMRSPNVEILAAAMKERL